MKRYEKSTLIACKIEALFAFHLDLNNLRAITPPDTKVELLEEIASPKEGDIVRLRSVSYFIPALWEVEIETLRAPTLLVDIALKSPFAYWKHSHIFTDLGDGMCKLKDVVEYRAPLGFVGEWFDFVIQHQLSNMFAYRHGKTIQILEGVT